MILTDCTHYREEQCRKRVRQLKTQLVEIKKSRERELSVRHSALAIALALYQSQSLPISFTVLRS